MPFRKAVAFGGQLNVAYVECCVEHIKNARGPLRRRDVDSTKKVLVLN